MKNFELQSGHEIRGMMIRLYPTPEQEKALRELEEQLRHAWNWLVGQVEEVWRARQAYAVREGLVAVRPTQPDYNGLAPKEAEESARAFREASFNWSNAVKKATDAVPGCEYRRLKEQQEQFGCKWDYQLIDRVIEWKYNEDRPRPEHRPNAHMRQALIKNYFTKSRRRKKRRKTHESMPLQTRSEDCFELGEFGTRRGQPFYNCQVRLNGLKLRGRLPGQAPTGRILQGVSITKKADGWWAAIKQEVPTRELPPFEAKTVIGLDVGLTDMVAMSDGRIVPNKRGREYAERIAGRQAAKKEVGRLHLAAARHTKHTIYNEVLKHVSKFEHIHVERLPANIGQRGSSTASSMKMIIAMLKERFGDRVREVEPAFTSQDCSQCGHRSKESWSYAHGRFGQCPACGYREHRDVNAARNVAAKLPTSQAVWPVRSNQRGAAR